MLRVTVVHGVVLLGEFCLRATLTLLFRCLAVSGGIALEGGSVGF